LPNFCLGSFKLDVFVLDFQLLINLNNCGKESYVKDMEK